MVFQIKRNNCNKKCYMHRYSAEAFASYMFEHTQRVLYPYFCADCNRFHLTSDSKGSGRFKKKHLYFANIGVTREQEIMDG